MKKHSKKDLKKLLTSYQNAVDLNMICSITNKEGIITYVNKKFCEISQYSEQELLGQSHNIIKSGFHSNSFYKKMWQTISSGQIWQGEVKSKAKNGTYFWVQSVIIPVLDDNMNIEEYFSLRFSIDEKKKREDEKLNQIKLLEEMLFMISHKVRQPVANILGLSSLFDDSIDAPDEILKLINHITTSITTLDLFANELTFFLEDRKKKMRKAV